MRSISGGMATALDKQLGQKPQLLVKIDWGMRPERVFAGLGGVRWYGYYDSVIGSNTIEGRLLEVSDISSTKKADNLGTIGTASFELSDDDGNLKETIDRFTIERRDVSIYQVINDNISLMTLLFVGKIISPILWSEGKRTLQINVETLVQDNEIGFAPETPTSVPSLTPLNIDAVGRNWPLVFGNVIRVPAMRVTRPVQGHINRPFQSPDTQFEVLDGSAFPQNVYIKINIDGVIFSGKFNQGRTFPDPDAPGGTIDGVNVFTVYESNLAKYVSIPFGTRLALDPGEDPATTAWLAHYIPIVNNYILVTAGGASQFLRVVRQEGLKVWFHDVATEVSGTAHLFTTGDQIDEVAKNGRVGWTLQETSSVAPVQVADIISRVPWKFLGNTMFTLWTGLPDTYVCNIIPGTIVCVEAYRTLSNEGRVFTHVPSIYYTKQENHAINVIDQFGNPKTLNTMSLQFITPIENFEGQGWEDQIYVTQRSSIGPNSSDVIKYLIQTYSNLTIDSTSFNAVQTLVDKYPVGFAYLDSRNVMRACEEIAFQTRCGLIIDQGIVFIKYISKKPSSDLDTIDNLVKKKSFEATFTSSENIVTKFKATWKDTYQGLTTNTKYIYAHVNQDKFGLYTRTYDFYVFNIQSLVQKSVDFWSNRLGNSWRMVKYTAFAPTLPFQIYDSSLMTFTDDTLLNPPPLGLLGIVQKYKYSPKTVPMIDLEFELPCVASGTDDIYNYWQSDTSDSKPADPTANFREVTFDLLLADNESRARQQMQNQKISPSIVTSTTGGVGFDGVVDLYESGYGNPATKTNVQVSWVNPSTPPTVGDHDTSYSQGDTHYTQNSAGGGQTWISTMITANSGGGNYQVMETIVPGGALIVPNVPHTAVEMNGSTVIQTGTYVFIIFISGVYYFWFPAGDCT